MFTVILLFTVILYAILINGHFYLHTSSAYNTKPKMITTLLVVASERAYIKVL